MLEPFGVHGPEGLGQHAVADRGCQMQGMGGGQGNAAVASGGEGTRVLL
jgi:hypothetical protein